ncbi:hypothetical protein BST97_11325 [Nonlabens spongiae]|uniref:Uncharacterized protein n=1 Tax=Nonlabens spongiae TaxID=331648 RepID=A0A1W6MM23_9FLAO|nr:hypothetical protein [Nonlabens spongiae]ARN78529.1 hypothetical protein BST97_11325 [Nonlabens spongiae]
MDIQATKLQLIEMLLRTEKQEVLNRLLSVFKDNQADWWDELSIEEQHVVQRGIEQMENNQLVDHKDVMKKFA